MREFCKLSRKLVVGGLLMLGVSALFGCGSATNNDQGTSFTLLGYFAEFPESLTCTDRPAGSLGAYVPLGMDVAEAQANPPAGIMTIAGMQNNLTQVFIRTDRVLIDYYIAGADRQPPSTTLSLSSVINPSVVTSSDGSTVTSPFDSSLPPSFGGQGCSMNYAQFFVLPTDIYTWVIMNKESLPEAPFIMTATATVQGITSAGDRIESNPASFDLYFTPGVVIAPTDGSGDEA